MKSKKKKSQKVKREREKVLVQIVKTCLVGLHNKILLFKKNTECVSSIHPSPCKHVTIGGSIWEESKEEAYIILSTKLLKIKH